MISAVQGLMVVYNYLTPEEHEELLDMALEVRYPLTSVVVVLSSNALSEFHLIHLVLYS